MGEKVFEDIKVLDFGWVVAVPWIVKYLADFGAEVIHVESRTHPDALRMSPPYKDNISDPDRSAYFVNYHCNSFGMTINLNHPSGKGIVLVKKLVAWADIVIENFSPGVIEKWGLGYKEIKKIKSDIIMVSVSQLGQTGPLSSMPGTGNQLVSLSGITQLSGYPDRDPSNLYGGFTDTGSARLTAVAVIAALDYRHRTGKGQYIDASQYEAGGAHFLAPLILDYTVNENVAQRCGNRIPHAVPHGVYPCKGDDRWCVITVFNEQQWLGLCRAMGNPSWTQEPKFSELVARKKNEDELDKRIAEWTKNQDRNEVMTTLQRDGVPAGVVSDFEDLHKDPNLNHRGFFWEVDHPTIGKHKYESQPFKLSKTPPQLRMPAPLMGEHNEYVCTEVLGMPDEEFVELLNQGVLE